MQALKFATANNLVTDDLAKQVVGKFKKQTEEGKADIINWLGDNKASPLLLPSRHWVKSVATMPLPH